jgi:hypothetical protein
MLKYEVTEKTRRSSNIGQAFNRLKSNVMLRNVSTVLRKQAMKKQ